MSQKLSGESFLAVLSKSGLIEPQRLHQLLEAYTTAGGDNSDPSRVADALVERHAITRWQADKLLQGKHKGYFLGKYRLLSLLGRGGMSSVYLAEHVLMRRNCAIKVLPAKRVGDSSYLARFHREAQAVASLDHPNIVRAYDVDHQADRDAEIHFLVMEYVEGLSLQELVAKQGTCSYSDAVDYVRQAALGLAHAHKAGLVHRDIKPGNLLLDKRGTVKILDLGLARFFAGDGDQEALTIQHDEKVLGTADYLAPEQALDSHSVDARADIYALGCTLYFLLTGHAPFTEGTLAQRLMAHQTKEPPEVGVDRPDMPASLTALLKKMMAKRADDRFSTAEETSDALLGWLSQNADPQWKAAHPDLLQGRGNDSTKRVAARVVAAIAKPASPAESSPVIPPPEPTPATRPAESGTSTALLTPGAMPHESGEILQSTAFSEHPASAEEPPAEPELAAFFAGLATPKAPPAATTVSSSSIHSGTGSSKLQSSPSGSPAPAQEAVAEVSPSSRVKTPSSHKLPKSGIVAAVATPEVIEWTDSQTAPAEIVAAAEPVAPSGPDFSFLSGMGAATTESPPESVDVEEPPSIVIDIAPKPIAKPAKAVAKATAKVVAKAAPVAKAVAKPVISLPEELPSPESLEQVHSTPEVQSTLNVEPSEIESVPVESPSTTDVDDQAVVAPEVTPAASPWDFLAPAAPEPAFDFAAVGGTVAAEAVSEEPVPEPVPEPILEPAAEVSPDLPEPMGLEAEPIAAVPQDMPIESGFVMESGFPTSSVSASRSRSKGSSRPKAKPAPSPSSGNAPASRKTMFIGGGIAVGLLAVVGLYMTFGGSGKPQPTPSTQQTTAAEEETGAEKSSSAKSTSAQAAKASPSRPAPAASWAQKRETTVGAGGEFATISAALAEIERNFDARNRGDRFLVKIAAGTYADRIQFTGKAWSQRDWGANVVLRGEGAVILAPSGSDPVVRLNNVGGVQLLNVTIKAEGKPVAIELAESLDRCLIQNVQVEGFTETGVLLNGALGPSFSSDRVTLEGMQLRGAATAVAVRAKKGSQSDSVDCQNILLKKCRFLGPMVAGVSVTGTEARAFEIRECIFSETNAGVELLDAAAWTDFLLLNNTFYKNDVAVRVARQPATTSKGFSLRRNLFFESRTADALVAEGFNEPTLFASQMLGTMFGNWTTRPVAETPAPGHLVIWGGGQQGQTGVQFASTTATDPKFLAPAENAPQKNVAGQGTGEPAWIGAVGP